MRGFNTRGQVPGDSLHLPLPQQEEVSCVVCSPRQLLPRVAVPKGVPKRVAVDLVGSDPFYFGSGAVIAMQQDAFSRSWMKVDSWEFDP